MAPPSWLAPHFSNGLRPPRRYLKVDGGYRLENKRRDELLAQLSDTVPNIQTSEALGRLEAQVAPGAKRDFLHETVTCYNAGANRAAVVMCWALAVFHLQEHILADADRLSAFDAVLAKNQDKRVRIKSVAKQDDFTEIQK
jgi:hypothetical protein